MFSFMHHESDDMEDPSQFSCDTSFIWSEFEAVHTGLIMPRTLNEKTATAKNKKIFDIYGPFTCTDSNCLKQFQNCCEFSRHFRETHTKRRKSSLCCQICEKRLDRDFNKDSSTARDTFSCTTCRKSFDSSELYDEHNRTVHAKAKPFLCTMCPKRFTQQGGLQQHIRMHTGLRPFTCTYCSKTFTQKAGLDQHLRTHTKVKPFVCIVCRKGFSQSVHLRQHMRTHTNIQPFKCSFCDQTFKQRSHLNSHVKTHPNVTLTDQGMTVSYVSGANEPSTGSIGVLNADKATDINILLEQTNPSNFEIVDTSAVVSAAPVSDEAPILLVIPEQDMSRKYTNPLTTCSVPQDMLWLNHLMPILEGDSLYYTASIDCDTESNYDILNQLVSDL